MHLQKDMTTPIGVKYLGNLGEEQPSFTVINEEGMPNEL
jgi:hypothetical protein